VKQSKRKEERMVQSAAAPTAHDIPAARSNLYKLLSIAFCYPTRELFSAFQSGEFMEEFLANLAALPYLNSLLTQGTEWIGKAPEDLQGVSFTDFEVKYVGTFDVGAPEPPYPPYEGVYRKGERTALMVEISEFYKHFGLQMNPEEGKRELPDHLCSELEFLHFLTFKEGQAASEDAPQLMKGYLLAQRDFLQRHMLEWVPGFADKLQDAQTVALYKELARIASVFLQGDFTWINSQIKDLS
jgi:putative dimethyl sulfoxide reductase chaperone